jgi:predicted site-specific integrase-resolvase
MLQDLVSVVTCFSARLYGSRGGRKVKDDIQKSIQELEKERSENSKNNHESHTD